ncbi:MAG: O-antigen ligase family protein [Firmicutes bacterium]|nr:O-antigen ligase family protein [Bacillota bacterium]
MKTFSFTPQNVTSAFLCAMATVFLLAVGPGGYTTITRFKFAAMLTLCGLYFVAMVVAFFLQKEKFSWPKFTMIHWLVIVFWGFCAVSTVASPYCPDTIIGFHRYEGLLTISCYVLTFLLVSFYGEPKPWLLKVFAVAMLLFCFLCFLQFLGRNPFTLYPEGLNYYDGNDAYRYEFLGTIGNVGLVAAVLSLAAMVFAVAAVRCRGKQRILYGLTFLAVVAVAAYSKVAAAYVAIFGGLLFLLPLAMVRDRKKKIILLLMIVCVLVAGFLFLFLVDLRDGLFHEVHVLLHGGWDDDFGTGRLFIWRNVMAIVPERPLLGGGPDTLGQRLTAEFQRYDEEKGVLYRASIDTAHNEYLNILVNEGALALGAYLAALILSFVAFVKKNPANPAAAICGGGVLGYSIQAFFGLRMCITSPFFWLAWALLLAAFRVLPQEEK